MKNQIQKIPILSKNLTLTGMMGVGKSTIGKNLAKKLKYNFIDIDKLIEINEGSSINLIFRNKSEKYFRKIESEITLQELKKNRINKKDPMLRYDFMIMFSYCLKYILLPSR